MISFKKRSLQKELLDAENIPFEDIKKNMQELDTINKLLGGHAITIHGLKKFITKKTTTLSVCEIGCGGGDNMEALANYCKQQKIALALTGIDIKKECIGYAVERNTHLDANWICSDYTLVEFENELPDVIFSSLFCHHFTRDELVDMLKWMAAHCRQGFFINDLHRHPLAYFSIKWITKIFSRSYLVKNDAPLSVARGFSKKEWQEIFTKAGIDTYSIRWKWAFRHLIVYHK
jgi:2-polyprenyl-3-methyl-5-hydroxy-6-metoxy-1,4-benzoquinol methylase